MQKLLYVLPHCSTGGMPQYCLRQIQEFINDFQISVIEVDFYGPAYVVQRNCIMDLVPFYALQGRRDRLMETIREINPDIIHFQELPHTFLSDDLIRQIFTPNRSYSVVASCHSSTLHPSTVTYTPDRFVMVNRWSQQRFQKQFPEVECDVWEYPIDKREVSWHSKQEARARLFNMAELVNISESQQHILNVGLFTPGKNQGELFEVARMNPHNCYHFVGNQAENFAFYWGPLMANLPKNCYVWGERSDVELFYQACDEFYFTSKLELNPICIREALSWQLPVKMYKLPTYLDDYDHHPLITFL